MIYTKVLLDIIYLDRFHSRSHMFAHGLAVLAECGRLFVCAMPGMTDLHSSVFRLIREEHKDIAYLY